jgi:hypothetical protein
MKNPGRLVICLTAPWISPVLRKENIVVVGLSSCSIELGAGVAVIWSVDEKTFQFFCELRK